MFNFKEKRTLTYASTVQQSIKYGTHELILRPLTVPFHNSHLYGVALNTCNMIIPSGELANEEQNTVSPNACRRIRNFNIDDNGRMENEGEMSPLSIQLGNGFSCISLKTSIVILLTLKGC